MAQLNCEFRDRPANIRYRRFLEAKLPEFLRRADEVRCDLAGNEEDRGGIVVAICDRGNEIVPTRP